MTVFSFNRLEFFKKLANICRTYSNKTTVRVRFAPSPTGFLHIGGLRTALFNHLFAKSQNGVTILRIEDTDLARKVDSATDNLIEDLAWCGIKFDEGPYFQSKRLEIYQKYADQLMNQGDAYYCFCGKTRLNLIRKELIKAGGIPKYDNACRHLTKEEINIKLGNGEIPCIRFKLSKFAEPVKDLIQDHMPYEALENEGDPIIVKADGFPTYHFANVIDDHLMKITHVFRGIEWQISTVKHILLYKAFNWEPPLYGHIPLLLNKDGSKLSKRHGDLKVKQLRENGYFPNALINFVARVGGGFTFKQEDSMKIFTVEELTERFDISKIKLGSSKIELNKLDIFNSLEIQRLLKTEFGINELIKKTQELITNHFQKVKKDAKVKVDPDHIRNVLERLTYRINKLEDLTTKNFVYLWIPRMPATVTDDKTVETIRKFVTEMNSVDWSLDNLKKFLKEFATENEINYPELMGIFRNILINSQEGPSVAELLDILGKEDVRLRLLNSIKSESIIK